MQLLYSLLTILNEMSPYILLGFLIAGAIHAFIPKQAFTRHLSGTGLKSTIKAAAVGVPLPLCSCGVLPTAISLRRNGASKAATTSFLIATPQTGVDSIAATWSLLGPAFAIIRPIAALVTAVFGGWAVGKDERGSVSKTEDRRAEISRCSALESDAGTTFGSKCLSALRYGFVDLVGSIGGWLVVGLIIAALITVYVPDDFFGIFGKMPLLSMIAAVIIAVPMYVCATGSIPIALSLMLKGLSPGTAFVLLMAGPAANFASFTLISKELGRKSASIYLASIIIGAIAFGLIIDYLLPARWFAVNLAPEHSCHHAHFAIFPTVCSAVLSIMLIFSLLRRHNHNHKHINTDSEMTRTYTIKGMNCPHCQASVAKSIQGVDGVKSVDVNLSTGIATVEGEHKPEDVVAAVRNAGFDIA